MWCVCSVRAVCVCAPTVREDPKCDRKHLWPHTWPKKEITEVPYPPVYDTCCWLEVGVAFTVSVGRPGQCGGECAQHWGSPKPLGCPLRVRADEGQSGCGVRGTRWQIGTAWKTCSPSPESFCITATASHAAMGATAAVPTTLPSSESTKSTQRHRYRRATPWPERAQMRPSWAHVTPQSSRRAQQQVICSISHTASFFLPFGSAGLGHVGQAPLAVGRAQQLPLDSASCALKSGGLRRRETALRGPWTDPELMAISRSVKSL